MKKLRTRTASELDNPKRWNQALKPWFDVERYQDRINDRVGLSRDGRPIVRLVWGQEEVTRAFGQTIPKYWTRRLRGYPGFVWYTVPRWIFERRLEPEQYTQAWNDTRYSLKDPSGGNLRCEDCGFGGEPELIAGKLYCRSCASTNVAGGVVIDKGPPPKELYTYMMECADHEGMMDALNQWPLCCTRAFYEDRRRCWGTYRQPGDFELEVITQSVRAMEASPHRDPYRPLTKQELFETELTANMQVERAQMQFEEYERQLLAEVQKTYPFPDTVLGAQHFSDPGPSFRLGEQRGIIVPE